MHNDVFCTVLLQQKKNMGRCYYSVCSVNMLLLDSELRS